METNGIEIRFEGCGQVIRQIRQDAQVSLRDLAARIGCGQGQLSKIENNALSLSQTMIEQIAAALEVDATNIVLMCLQARFPKLLDTPAGQEISKSLRRKGTSHAES